MVGRKDLTAVFTLTPSPTGNARVYNFEVSVVNATPPFIEGFVDNSTLNLVTDTNKENTTPQVTEGTRLGATVEFEMSKELEPYMTLEKI